jgi:amidase
MSSTRLAGPSGNWIARGPDHGARPQSEVKSRTNMTQQFPHQRSSRRFATREGEDVAADLLFSSAMTLAAAIRSGRVSAIEVLEAHLAQIERHNPAVNAIVIIDIEGARARAHEADAALGRGKLWGPLHGVPFTLKDAHLTAGMRTTVGCPLLVDYVSPEDSTITARLRAAGGVLVGKTNVPMMLADYQSNNPVFGRTNNPWNIGRTSGGSSGGAAAALAAGMTPFEVGTDLSSSIRIPAHFCGVFGFKPTENRIPLTGLFPNPRGTPRSVRLMSSIGPMARTIEDLVLLYQIISGPDGRDTDVRPCPAEEMPQLDLKNLRIVTALTFPGFPVAADVRNAAEDLARKLESFGAIVGEAILPQLDFTQELSRAGELIGMMLAASQPEEERQPTTLVDYFNALHRRDQSIVAWEGFFDNCDALLCPASMVTAFPHCEPGTPLEVNGRDVEYRMVSAHGALFNYSGHPAVVLPYKLDRNGLPIGLQLVGKRWNDFRLLAIAKAVSAVTGGFQRAPHL